MIFSNHDNPSCSPLALRDRFQFNSSFECRPKSPAGSSPPPLWISRRQRSVFSQLTMLNNIFASHRKFDYSRTPSGTRGEIFEPRQFRGSILGTRNSIPPEWPGGFCRAVSASRLLGKEWLTMATGKVKWFNDQKG